MSKIQRKVIIAPKDLSQSINSDIEYLRDHFGADRKDLIQKDVDRIQDVNKDTLYMIYVENKITESTNLTELIDVLSRTIDTRCAHLEHKVTVLFFSGEPVTLPEDPKYKKIIMINKNILPRVDINKLNISYSPLLIDFEMIAYFGEQKINDLKFQRVINTYNESKTLYILPERQLKFATRKFRELFVKAGYQIIIVNKIEEIDVRVKTKALILSDCESNNCNQNRLRIKEYTNELNSKLGPYCEAHLVFMSSSNFCVKQKLEIPYSECPFYGVFNEDGILMKYEIEEIKLKQVFEKILSEMNF